MRKLLAAVALISVLALRCLHLGADTPRFVSEDAGVYVDEGYKTLDARNLVLFGSTRPIEADDYEGWLEASPLSQWPYYLAFEIAGVDIRTARALSILYFGAFLGLYIVAHRKRYRSPLLLGGLLGLAMDPVLFFYSRVALFEPLMIVCVYAFVLWLPKESGARLGHLAVALLTTGLVAYGIKRSGLLYGTPICMALLLQLGLRHGIQHTRVTRWLTVPLLVAGLGLTYLLHVHVGRLAIWPPWGIPERMLQAPLWTATVTTLPGLLLSAYVAIQRPRFWLDSAYRGSLLALVILGPAVVGLFAYDPLRYYVPLIPAFILLLVEHLHVASATATPGDAERTIRRWAWRTAGAVFVGFAALRIGSFLLEPTYDAEGMRRRLVAVVPEDSVVIGDWAPFFALGTRFHGLYMNNVYNTPARIHETRPDYLLYSNNYNSNHAMDLWSSLSSVQIGAPELGACYNGTEVVLFPLAVQPERINEDDRDALNVFHWKSHREYVARAPRSTRCH